MLGVKCRNMAIFHDILRGLSVPEKSVNHDFQPESLTDFSFTIFCIQYAVGCIYALQGRLALYSFSAGPPATNCAIELRMNSEDIMRRIELLRQEHRDLDSAITALIDNGSTDQLQLARLKKRKLMLRDEIAELEDSLIPDIIA